MLHTETPQRQTARKTWNQYNGSCGLIMKLRYRLAEEGCIQSQVSIARKLLSESVGDHASAEVAVSYLLRAAEQSDSEGLQLLEECYSSGYGITERNRGDVESCLGKSECEKMAQRIAKGILDTVTQDGSVTLNESVFRKRLVDGNCLTPDVDLKPRVGFADIARSVKHCVEGRCPALSIISEQPYLHRLQYLENLVSNCTTSLCDFHLWINLLLTALFSLVIYVLAYEPALVTVLQQQPLILCYVSLALAVAFTAQFHCQKKIEENFFTWTDLASRFDDTVVQLTARRSFRQLSHAKLLLFCLVLVTGLCLFTSQIRYAHFVTFSKSDLTALAVVIVVCVFYDTLARSRVKLSIVWSIFLLLSADLYLSTCRMLSLESESSWHHYLHWLVIAIKACLYCRIGYKDGYVAAITYFMGVTWLYTCQHMMQNCPLDLLLPTCGIVSWTIASKYLGHEHGVVLVVLVKLFQLHSWVKVSFYCCILYCIYKCVTTCTVKLSSALSWKKLALTLLCALLAVGVCDLYYGTEEVNLDLDHYAELCRGLDSNLVAVESCNPLLGAKTRFVGRVTSVDVVDTRNAVKSLTGVLPRSVQAAVACAIGEKWPACHKKFQSERSFAMCQLYTDIGLPPCHLETWNVNDFEIGIKLDSGLDVKLVINAACGDFVHMLKEYDEIDVTGRLMSGVDVPKVALLRGTSSGVLCEARRELSLDSRSYLTAFVAFFRFVF